MKILKNSIIGISAGFITGFFSTGGGMIVLPAIIYFLGMDEKRARATSIFSVLPMVIVAAFYYYKKNFFDFTLGIKCAVGGIIGGFIGTRLLDKISNKFLQSIFIFFLLYAAYNMLK